MPQNLEVRSLICTGLWIMIMKEIRYLGFLTCFNTALVQWFCKKQSTVETSVFGAEFVPMKQGIDALRGLRYKYRMMGIPILGP